MLNMSSFTCRLHLTVEFQRQSGTEGWDHRGARMSAKARAPRGYSRKEGAADRGAEAWPEGLWVAKSGILSSLGLSPCPFKELSPVVQCLLTYIPSGR